MKKFKLLPAVLMLVLCVGVLAIGVFAITPTKNTISGTITVNASNNLVQIEVLNGTTSLATYPEVRGGQPISFGDTSFVTATANRVHEVPEVRLTLKVTNKSNKTLGAFFTKSDVTFADGEYAELEDILVKDTISDYVDFYCSSYTPIEAGDTEEMAISLTLKKFNTTSADVVANLNHVLYIEEYVPTPDADPDTDGWQAPALELPEEDPDDEDFELYSLGGDPEYKANFVKVPENATYSPNGCGIYAIPRSSAGTSVGIDSAEYDEDNEEPAFYRISNIPNKADLKVSVYNIYYKGDIMCMPFIPSLVNNVNYGNSNYVDPDEVQDRSGAFVSLENQTYSNDSQFALYNKDKTGVYFAGPNSVTYLPSTITSTLNGTVFGYNEHGSNYDLDFSACVNLTSLEIDCSSAMHIDLSNTKITSVTIGLYAFAGFTFDSTLTNLAFNLTETVGDNANGNRISITFKGKVPPTITGYISVLDTALNRIIVPTGCKQAYVEAFKNCSLGIEGFDYEGTVDEYLNECIIEK